MTQPEFASLGGVQKRAQVSYEGDERAPDAAYLAAVGAKGVDVLYVLTGERRGGRGAHAPPVNTELFAACMVAADEELKLRGLVIEPERRVRLYWGVYEMSLPQGKLNAAVVAPMVNVLA